MRKKISVTGCIAVMLFFAGMQVQAQTADKVVAVVGDNIILLSDIEGQYAQYISQGNTGGPLLKCQILESLLTQRLLQNQAVIDSVEVSEDQVEDELNRRVNYFVSQTGSQEKLEQFIGKSLIEFKEEMRDDIRAMIQAQSMQSEITKNVNITPSDVKTFYQNIPKDSLPYFNTEVEVAQIVKKPVISKASKDEAKAKLNALRDRVRNGEDFSTLAILYSQDGSARNGGELGFVGRGDLVKAFEGVAFKIKPGEVSPVVETEFGFHIVQLIERRGEQVNVRHILIKPVMTGVDLEGARFFLDSIYNLIQNKEISFAEAAAKFSDDDQTKNNNGLLQNQQEGSTRIPTDQLDPSMFFVIDTMKVGNVSQPNLFRMTSNDQAYRLIHYVSKTEPHQANLKDDYQKIKQAAQTEKENKVMKEWFDKKMKTTYLKLSNDYMDCESLKSWYEVANKVKTSN
jgi:peptidyl-prolyl cis-trans isomerase SurA